MEYSYKSNYIVEEIKNFSVQGLQINSMYRDQIDDFEQDNAFPMKLFSTSLEIREKPGYSGAVIFPTGYYNSELIIYRRTPEDVQSFEFAFLAKGLPKEVCINVLNKLTAMPIFDTIGTSYSSDDVYAEDEIIDTYNNKTPPTAAEKQKMILKSCNPVNKFNTGDDGEILDTKEDNDNLVGAFYIGLGIRA